MPTRCRGEATSNCDHYNPTRYKSTVVSPPPKFSPQTEKETEKADFITRTHSLAVAIEATPPLWIVVVRIGVVATGIVVVVVAAVAVHSASLVGWRAVAAAVAIVIVHRSSIAAVATTFIVDSSRNV